MRRFRKQASPVGPFATVRARPRPTGLEGVVVVAVLALAAFGSLTPFSFDLAEAGSDGVIGRLGWPRPDAADVVTNIIVYVPIGAALAVLFLRRFAAPAAVVLAVLCGTGLSFTVEVLQTAIATRFPSWLDVITNAAGTTAGALGGLVFGPPLMDALWAVRRGVAALGNGRSSGSPSWQRSLVPTSVILLAWLIQMALIFTRQTGACELLLRRPSMINVNCVPFSEYFYQPIALALSSMAVVFTTYALLTVTTTALIRRLRAAGRRRLAGVTVALAVGGGAILALQSSGRVSVSDLVLALVSLAVTARVYRFCTDEDNPGLQDRPAVRSTPR